MRNLKGLLFGVRVASLLLICLFYFSTVFSQNASSASATLHFPHSISGGHALFGIPLLTTEETQSIGIYDAQGNVVPADVFPLQNWEENGEKWALVAFPASPIDTERQTYTLRTSKEVPQVEEKITWEALGEDAFAVSNSFFTLTLNSKGLQSIGSSTVESTAVQGKAGILETGAESPLLDGYAGSVELLYNGSLYKKVRLTRELGKGILVLQEWDLFANSPYIRCQTRLVNTGADPISLNGMYPLEIAFKSAINNAILGLTPEKTAEGKQFSIHQGYHDWLAALDNAENMRGNAGTLEEWVAVELSNGLKVQWVFPHFQEMAAQAPDRESLLSLKQNTLKVQHYKAFEGTQDSKIGLTAGSARSFTYWMVVNPGESDWKLHASHAKAMPYVSYEGDYLSKSSLLPENAAGDTYDSLVRELIAPIGQAASLRDSLPIASPFPLQGLDYGWNKAAQDQLLSTNNTWDISLALTQTYLRTGHEALGRAAFRYALLQADQGVNRNTYSNLPPNHPSYSEQVEGLLAAYHTWGEPWFYESAQILAQKATGRGDRGSGNAEVVPSLNFLQQGSMGKKIQNAESDLAAQAYNAYRQTLSYAQSQNTASFYIANAAWFGLVEGAHDTSNTASALTMAQGLPYFAGLAEGSKKPFVIRASGEASGTLSYIRLSPSITWDGKTFTFALQRNPEISEPVPAHTGAIQIEVFMPVQKVSSVKVGGNKVEYSFDPNTSILSIPLLPAGRMTSYRIEVGGR
ncbi:MAG: hypothetical protein AAF694_12715 [Bacteroidota bacterium]